jgi:hypothetical protein
MSPCSAASTLLPHRLASCGSRRLGTANRGLSLMVYRPSSSANRGRRQCSRHACQLSDNGLAKRAPIDAPPNGRAAHSVAWTEPWHPVITCLVRVDGPLLSEGTYREKGR